LELLSEDNYDAFCLAYMFTYRDFDGGTLGLAWTGDVNNAGGVCERNGVRIRDRVWIVLSADNHFNCVKIILFVNRRKSEDYLSAIMTVSTLNAPKPCRFGKICMQFPIVFSILVGLKRCFISSKRLCCTLSHYLATVEH